MGKLSSKHAKTNNRVTTFGIEHNPTDPLDFGRQWFYRVLNHYNAERQKAGGKDLRLCIDGSPEHVDWNFLDNHLPKELSSFCHLVSGEPPVEVLQELSETARKEGYAEGRAAGEAEAKSISKFSNEEILAELKWRLSHEDCG